MSLARAGLCLAKSAGRSGAGCFFGSLGAFHGAILPARRDPTCLATSIAPLRSLSSHCISARTGSEARQPTVFALLRRSAHRDSSYTSPVAVRLARTRLASSFASPSGVALPNVAGSSSDSDGRSTRPDAILRTAAAEEDGSDASSISRPVVAYHLFFCAALVYLIIVVGGLTRLTESGLSIAEWNPGFKGMRLPWTDAEWDAEWEKYRRTPEWALLNRHMTVDDFKSIYMWEWSHRILGRVIGMVFVLPSIYFLSRGYVARGSRWKIVVIASGIGFQGALGWFMVKSGLSAPEATPPVVAQSHPDTTAPAGSFAPRLDSTVSQDGLSSTASDWHPRVSHFRLAAHLGTAFAVYLGMLHTGLTIVREHRVATATGRVGGLNIASGALNSVLKALRDPRVARFRITSRAMLGLAFFTAMSGALVAGLDAGLVYSEFPYMGDGFVPPRDELLDDRYQWGGQDAGSEVKGASGRLVLGNVTQNPVTVQLVHRCLAITTLLSALGLGVYARRLSKAMSVVTHAGSLVGGKQGIVKAATLPPIIPRLALGVAGMASLQATLGISTLIYLVPLELASAHQAGSVALLSFIVALLVSLRQPSAAARLLATRRGALAQTAKAASLSPEERNRIAAKALSRIALRQS